MSLGGLRYTLWCIGYVFGRSSGGCILCLRFWTFPKHGAAQALGSYLFASHTHLPTSTSDHNGVPLLKTMGSGGVYESFCINVNIIVCIMLASCWHHVGMHGIIFASCYNHDGIMLTYGKNHNGIMFDIIVLASC